MFGFHKSKMYRSLSGCCICKTKSSSSRFTCSQRYQENFRPCFGLREDRTGDICNACVLLVKRWKKLPSGCKKNWNHVVDARAGPGLKLMKPRRFNSIIKRKQKRKLRAMRKLKMQNSDAHSTSSSSPSQSPSYSIHSDESSDTEIPSSRSSVPLLSFLDLTYWKRLDMLYCVAAFPYRNDWSKTLAKCPCNNRLKAESLLRHCLQRQVRGSSD